MNNYLYKTISFLFYTLSIVSTNAQDNGAIKFGSDSVYQEYYLGFNLIPNAGGSLVNFALIKPQANGKQKVILLTQDNFISQCSGKQKSLGNPDKINFFKKYNIKNLAILNNLWKLRYTEYPYRTEQKPEKGWSQNDEIPYIPSLAQLNMLKKFGIERLNDYFYGEKAFKLLQAIENPQWLKSYKEAY